MAELRACTVAVLLLVYMYGARDSGAHPQWHFGRWPGMAENIERRTMFGSEWILWESDNMWGNYFDAHHYCNKKGFGGAAPMTYKEFLGMKAEWWDHRYESSWDNAWNHATVLWLGIRRKKFNRRYQLNDYFPEEGDDSIYQLPWHPGQPASPPDLSKDSCVYLVIWKPKFSYVRAWVNESSCEQKLGIGRLCRRDTEDECESSPCAPWRQCVNRLGGYVCEETERTPPHYTSRPTNTSTTFTRSVHYDTSTAATHSPSDGKEQTQNGQMYIIIRGVYVACIVTMVVAAVYFVVKRTSSKSVGASRGESMKSAA